MSPLVLHFMVHGWVSFRTREELSQYRDFEDWFCRHWANVYNNAAELDDCVAAQVLADRDDAIAIWLGEKELLL